MFGKEKIDAASRNVHKTYGSAYTTAKKSMNAHCTLEWSLFCKNRDTSKIKLCGQILCYGAC